MFILLAFMYALLGLTFIFGSIAMHYAAPIFFIGMRMGTTAVLILGYLLVRRADYRIKREDIGLIVVLGVVHIFIPYVGEYFALGHMPAAKVSLIWSLGPFVTALFAWFFFKERMTRIKAVGLVIGILGFIPVVMHESAGEQALSSFLHVSTADLALLMIVTSASFAWNFFKHLLNKGYKPLVLNGWAMLIGSLLAFATSPFVEVWNPVPVTNWPVVLACMFALVITGGVICYNIYGYMLHKYTATFLSFAGGCVPFCTAFFQWIILGQVVSAAFMTSLCIIMVGLYIFYKEELRQGYIAHG